MPLFACCDIFGFGRDAGNRHALDQRLHAIPDQSLLVVFGASFDVARRFACVHQSHARLLNSLRFFGLRPMSDPYRQYAEDDPHPLIMCDANQSVQDRGR